MGMILLRKKHNFLTGAAVMAAASVLCKILSAVFKIPLDRFFLHEEGIAVFQSVCSVYNVFLAFCITGIPIALSSLVASSDEKTAADLRKSTFYSVTAVCGVCAVLLFLFADNAAVFLSGGGSALSGAAIRVAAPAILFMGVIAAQRGFFQGSGDMRPSALSQIAESFTKATLGTLFCALTIKKGIEYGAAGAMAGVALGTVFSALVLLLCHKKNKSEKGSFKPKLAMQVLRLSLPVTLGAFGFTAVILCDTLTVPNILAACKVAEIERLRLFGYLTRANTIYNLPATIITAVTASIVPFVSASAGNKEKLSESLFKSVKLLFIIAVPCGFGLILFAPQVLSLVYSSAEHYGLLALIGALVLIIPYIQATTATLQAIGKVYKPIMATFVAILIKLALNFILIPRIGIEGAPASTAIAFTVAFILNTKMLSKNLPIRAFAVFMAKVFLCGGISCGAAKLLYNIHPAIYMLPVCILVAATIYFGSVVLSRTVTKADIKGL